MSGAQLPRSQPASMMKRSSEGRIMANRIRLAVALGIGSLSASAAAQSSSALIACAIHYGDSDTQTDVTPAAEITVPFADVSNMGLGIAWRITAQKLTTRFYKAECARGSNMAELRKRLKQWEENSGYGERPWRPIRFEDSFPSILDEMHKMQGMRPQPRTAFSARDMGPVMVAGRNDAIEAERTRRAAVEANRKPPQQLEIGISEAARAPVNAAEERYQRELAAYGEALAAQKKAVEDHAAALAAEQAKAAGNAERAAAAKAAHDAEVARAEQARAAYRAEYRRVTGRDPAD
jgi:hypothetical protein